MNRFIWFAICTLIITSCEKDEIPVVEEVSFIKPEHFPEPIYDFQNNPVTRDGFELGRMLFYDNRLSSDNTVSCASCHHPELAFSDAGKPLSQGVADAFGDRNSPSLSNLAWYPAFMWDGGVNHIEISSLAAIVHPRELNMDFASLLDKIRGIPQYQLQFEKAFGSPGIDDQRFFYAITQFMGLFISADSKFDQVVRGEENFSAIEEDGKLLFDQHCANCHSGVLQSDFSYRNNGLDSVFIDEGRKMITNNSNDLGKFRVPSLRNVFLTAPYMHDGRFNTLEEVVDHYVNHIKTSSTLDPTLLQGLEISNEERSAIVAFLKTLTDEKFIQNESFSSPF